MVNKARVWPFPGDVPVVRARKIALAYRQAAKDLQDEVNRLLDEIKKVDPRVIGWLDDDSQLPLIHKHQNEGKDRPDPVGELDARFYEWGETWHSSYVRAFDPDDMITTNEAAAILNIANGSVGRLRSRGKLEGEWRKNPGIAGFWVYRAADVYALSAQKRGRPSREDNTTDSMPTSGDGAAE